MQRGCQTREGGVVCADRFFFFYYPLEYIFFSRGFKKGGFVVIEVKEKEMCATTTEKKNGSENCRTGNRDLKM